MTFPTVIDVLDNAIALWSQPDGVSVDVYSKNVPTEKNGERWDDTESNTVVSACAIGGIEHSVWKLTGESVQAIRDDVEHIRVVAPGDADAWGPQHVLYAEAMAALNSAAYDLYGDIDAQVTCAEYALFRADFLGENPRDVILKIAETARERVLVPA